MRLASVVTALLVTAASAPVGHIVAEWDPGITEAEAGGQLVIDSYGVNGFGAYRVALDDGTSVLAVCIQADLGHSTAATYAPDPAIVVPDELAYLLWAYLAGGQPTEVQAAVVNVLAWRYVDAQRRTGGPVWHGDTIELRALGVGRLAEVEQAVAGLHAEAVARRGPWTLINETSVVGQASVRLTGPGGPIGGVAVRFTATDGWSAAATTDANGAARAEMPANATTVRARVDGPGAAVALVAPGSQRLAMAGPSAIVTVDIPMPAAPTATTTSTTTPSTTTTSTTSVPAATTSTTTTVPAATTSTTTTVPAATTSSVAPTSSTTPTTTTIPVTTTEPVVATSTALAAPSTTAPGAVASARIVTRPPALPRTGSRSRPAVRIAALSFAGGSFVLLLATPRVRRRS